MKKNDFKLFDKLPGLKSTLSQKYINSIRNFTASKNPTISPKKWPKEWMETYYKGYPRFSALKLAEATDFKNRFGEVLKNRRSTRNFSNNKISYQKLSNILYYSGGEYKVPNLNNTNYRFYPSGGARYPLEIYPIVRKVDGLKEGVYHYYVRNNLLEILEKRKILQSFVKKAFVQPDWQGASVFLAITAVMSRSQIKYQERTYKLALIELGHLCQNIYLICSALNVGCCEINGYDDPSFNELLDIDGIKETMLIVIALGTLK